MYRVRNGQSDSIGYWDSCALWRPAQTKSSSGWSANGKRLPLYIVVEPRNEFIIEMRKQTCRTKLDTPGDDDSRFLRLDPIVRRDVFHVQVVDGKMIRCGRSRWCKYRINNVGRVKALFEVGFGREVGCGSGGRGTTPPPRFSEVDLFPLSGLRRPPRPRVLVKSK